MAMGRPTKFETSDELWQKFIEWQEELSPGGSLHEEVPDVEGFCNFISCYRDLFSEYEKKPEFSDTIKRIRNWMHYRKKQLAFRGKLNPAVFIFDMKNNAGYADKQETDITTNGKDLPTPILGGSSVRRNNSNPETTDS